MLSSHLMGYINIRTGEIGITLPTLPYDTHLADRVNLLIFLELAGVRLHTYTATNHPKPLSLLYVGIISSKLSSFSLSLSYLVLSERKLVFYYLPGPTRFKPMCISRGQSGVRPRVGTICTYLSIPTIPKLYVLLQFTYLFNIAEIPIYLFLSLEVCMSGNSPKARMIPI